MSTVGLCGAARWQKSQLLKSNMFTEGENVWMEAGDEMTASCCKTTNVTGLRMNWRHAAAFANSRSAVFLNEYTLYTITES